MMREIVTIRSASLHKDMEISIYGHFGTVLLMFPSTSDEHLQNEEDGFIESIEAYIKSGRIRVYSVSTVNFESWLNNEIPNESKSKRHFEFDKFISDEVVRFIYEDCAGAVPIITFGSAIGAFHAANSYFKRPDLFLGTIALSGTFNIEHFCGSYFDDNCYFNSPVHYLPNLTDNYWLTFLRSRHHVYLLTGSGENEFPGNSIHLSQILSQKEIPHHIDVWGPEFGHNKHTWCSMLAETIGKIL